MNIFVLDLDHKLNARCHVDSHIVKMPLETAQILSTVCGGPYRPTHVAHPCTLWCAESIDNAVWLRDLGLALCREYSYRYDREHRCESVIRSIEPAGPSIGLTPHALAMPDQYKTDDAVRSYRNYYHTKSHLFKWKRGFKPLWLTHT